MPNPKDPALDNRAAIAMVQRQVCGAEIAARARHDNPDHDILAGDLLMFQRRGDGFQATGIIRAFPPEMSIAVSASYEEAMAILFPPPNPAA